MTTDAQAPAEPTANPTPETDAPAAPPVDAADTGDATPSAEEIRDYQAKIKALEEVNARLHAKAKKAEGSMSELELLQARVSEMEERNKANEAALALERALVAARDAGITDPKLAEVFARGLIATESEATKAAATAKAKEQLGARAKRNHPTTMPQGNGAQKLTAKQRTALALQQAARGVYTGSS